MIGLRTNPSYVLFLLHLLQDRVKVIGIITSINLQGHVMIPF